MLMMMLASGSWALYVGAQDFQNLLAETSSSENLDSMRYQFTDHVFLQNGRQLEILLRLDRFTGETWRYHASQSAWSPISEPDNSILPISSGESRYELISHVYRDQLGRELELFVRVDFVDGNSWSYQGMSGSWDPITVESSQDSGQVETQTLPESSSGEAGNAS